MWTYLNHIINCPCTKNIHNKRCYFEYECSKENKIRYANDHTNICCKLVTLVPKKNDWKIVTNSVNMLIVFSVVKNGSTRQINSVISHEAKVNQLYSDLRYTALHYYIVHTLTTTQAEPHCTTNTHITQSVALPQNMRKRLICPGWRSRKGKCYCQR